MIDPNVRAYHTEARALHTRPDKPIPNVDRKMLRDTFGIEVDPATGIPLSGQSSVLTADLGPSRYMVKPNAVGTVKGVGLFLIYDIRETPYNEIGHATDYQTAIEFATGLIVTDILRMSEGGTHGLSTAETATDANAS